MCSSDLFLHYARTANELALMRTLKRALDPKNILNPGRVLDAATLRPPAA